MGIISNSTIGSGQVVEPAVKGDITTFSNAVVNFGVAPASNGKVLTQKVDEATGLIWKFPVASKGGLLSNNATAPTELPVGTDNQVLTANSSATNGIGLEWKTPVNLNFNAKGDLESFTGTVAKILPIGGNGQILQANSTATSDVGMEWVTSSAGNAPISFLGQLTTHSLTAPIVINAGSNDAVLTADDTATQGLRYKFPDTKVQLTTKADLITFGTAVSKLGVGSDGQVLTADDNETVGLKWATPIASNKSIMGIGRTTIFDNPSLTTKVITQTIPMSGNESNSLAFYNTTPASAEWVAPIGGAFDDWTMELESVIVSGTDFFDIEIQVGTATPINVITGIFNAQTGGVSGAINVPFNNSDLIKILVTPSGVLDSTAVLKIRSFNWSFTPT